MASSTTDLFEQLQSAFKTSGAAGALALLADQLREQKHHHGLFQVRQMQVRSRLGLPLQEDENESTQPEPLRTQLEEGYLQACREVGRGLLDEGKVREAWAYLQVSGDIEEVRTAMTRMDPSDENVTELVEVALYERVAPRFGFELVLQHYGTCNAISTLEAQLPALSPADQAATAGMIVSHLHRELLENVRADIERRREQGTHTQDEELPESATLASLVAGRPWLLADQNYHVDTSHLSAVMRFSRLLDNPESLRLAVDLTEYGRRLDAQFQYPGEEPFVDVYPAHARYLRALLGEDVEEALALFRRRAEELDIEVEGSLAAEVVIRLLAHHGRLEEAIDETLRLIPADVHTTGFAPGLWELSRRLGRYDKILEVCRQRDDAIGYLAGLIGGSFP